MERPMSHFETQAMVAKGDNEERAARTRHIEDVARDLRAEFRREVMELREDVGELVAEVHKLLQAESATRATADGAVLQVTRAARERNL